VFWLLLTGAALLLIAKNGCGAKAGTVRLLKKCTNERFRGAGKVSARREFPKILRRKTRRNSL